MATGVSSATYTVYDARMVTIEGYATLYTVDLATLTTALANGLASLQSAQDSFAQNFELMLMGA